MFGPPSIKPIVASPGSAVDFAVNGEGQVVQVPAKRAASRTAKDRFESARGGATVKWRTEDLMRLLRDDG